MGIQELPTGAIKRDPDDATSVATFLAGYPPFDRLDQATRDALAAGIGRRRVTAGEAVLVEGGPPGENLFVVRDGSVELLSRGVVFDVLTQGDVFGEPTLLSGLPPEMTVRARKDTTLYLISRAAAVELLTRPGGVAFVATSLRDRLLRTARALYPSADSRTVPVLSLVRRPPVFCAPETPVRDVARIMSDEVVTAVLVKTREGLGIVTDADLRNKVLATDASAATPVVSIASVPARTIAAERLAQEASIEMMQAGVNHLVVVDPGGAVLGVVSAGSLMAPDALSPFALRWSISAAASEEAVVEVAARLPDVFVALREAHLDAPSLCRVVTLVGDALTRRLLELGERRLGPPPVPYSWLALGGAARGELTLASDQDNALAYADTDDQEVDAYFAQLGRAVNLGLERCGFALDESGVLAQDRHWRMALTDWVRVFRDCYDVWDWAHTARACIAFDFRHVHGALDVVAPLTEVILDAPRYPSLLNRLARSVVDARSPLGFRRRLPETLDIKKVALLPIENIARYYALAARISVAPTLDRLRAVGDIGALRQETVSALDEAYRAMAQVRLRQHAESIRTGRPPSDVVVTATLDPLTHVDVVEALRLIDAARKELPRVL